jgi:hypothetical protein
MITNKHKKADEYLDINLKSMSNIDLMSALKIDKIDVKIINAANIEYFLNCRFRHER